MNHRRYFAFGATALSLVLPVVGCGDYADPKPPGTGGTAGSGGTTMAGTGGTAGAGMGGTGGTAGTAGSAAGTGGTAGTGGSSGGAAGTGAGAGGTAGGGAAGTAGTGGDAGTAGTAGTGGGAPVECPDPVPEATPCGGDLSGTWTVASCTLPITGVIDMTGFGLGCTEATITSGSLTMTGQITFANGMFTDNTTTVGEEVIEMPHECLNVSGTVTACDRVGGPVQSSLGFTTFNCVDNAATQGCTCSATFDQDAGYGILSFDPLPEGEYTVTGTSFFLETDDEDVDIEHAYCVNGETMTTAFATAPRIGTIDGTLVLVKQIPR